LSMSSDYLPDQRIVPDDLIFQVPLLGVSLLLFTRSLLPIIKASFVSVTDLDNIVYELLFKPVGVSWWQFRSMVATCIDWQELEPGYVLEGERDPSTLVPGDDLIEDGRDTYDSEDHVDFLYWLYDGDVTAHYEGSFVTRIERTGGKCIDDPTAVGLLADMRFLYNLDMKNRAKQQVANDRSDDRLDIVEYPMATIRVGNRGAKVMRIDSTNLLDLMEHDDQLAASIRALLLKSLQRKVGMLLRSTKEQTTDGDLDSVEYDEIHSAPPVPSTLDIRKVSRKRENSCMLP